MSSSDLSTDTDYSSFDEDLNLDDGLGRDLRKAIIPVDSMNSVGVKCRHFLCCVCVSVYGMNFYFHVAMVFALGIMFNAEEEEKIFYKVLAYLYPSPLVIIPILNFVALVIGLVKELWGGIAGLVVGALNLVIYPYWIFWVSKQECCRFQEQIWLVYIMHGASLVLNWMFAFDCVTRYIRGLGKKAIGNNE